jgi:hypothetical protein
LNLQEQFYQVMTNSRLRSSRAASTKDARITEMMNGLLVSKPLKKIEHISEPSEPQAQVWNITSRGPVIEQESKAASVPGINKLKVIHDFITIHN